jgi:hypothetical protein
MKLIIISCLQNLFIVLTQIAKDNSMMCIKPFEFHKLGSMVFKKYFFLFLLSG